MSAVLRAGKFVVRLFCLSNHRWLVAAFAAIAVTVGTLTASAADPIAIRLLHAAHVGADVDLEATGQNATGAHFSWKLEERPKHSKAKISDHNSAQTSFRPDVPGLYIVRVTVRLRNLSLTATLSVSPSCATDPLTPVNTIDVVNNEQGMTVGTCFWQATQPTQFQVVYLYRNSANGNPLTAYTIKYATGSTAYAVNQTGITAMYNDFNALPTDGSVLVLVALPASAGTIPSSLVGQPSTTNPPSLQAALAKIGAVVPPTYLLASGAQNCWASNLLNCYGYISNGSTATWKSSAGTWNDQLYAAGSFSVIGVSGMSAGNAWYDSAVQRETTQGPLIGYLTPSSELGVDGVDAYTFVFTPYNATDTGQYAVVDSCAVTATSNCAIVVGKQIQFQQNQGSITEQVTWLHECDPQQGVNGLNLMVLDRVTLAPLTCTTVTSTSALEQALQFSTGPTSPTEGGHEQFQSPLYFSDRVVVVIQSVGTLAPLPPCFPTTQNPCPAPPPVSPTPISYANDPSLRLIDQLGGTPETFALAIGAPASGTTATGAYPYALIGVASNLPWHGKGVESSPLIKPGQPCFISQGSSCVTTTLSPGHVRAALSRDRMARYTPQAGDSTGTGNLDLYPIIYQNTVPWPYSKDDPTNGSPATVAAIAYIAGVIGIGPDFCDIRSDYSTTNIKSWTALISLIPASAPSSWPPPHPHQLLLQHHDPPHQLRGYRESAEE
jgi:hypothetical protein